MPELINDAFRTTGKALRGVLRSNGVTVAELAKRTGLTQKRIRQVLAMKVVEGTIAIDYIEATHGTLPPRYRAALRSLYKSIN
jgi:transcriptional regulator with XRE-family HTH domain